VEKVRASTARASCSDKSGATRNNEDETVDYPRATGKTGGKTGGKGGDSSAKKQHSHSAKAGLQVSHHSSLHLSPWIASTVLHRRYKAHALRAKTSHPT